MMDRRFTRQLFIIAVPIMLQNLIMTSLSFLDTLMLGQLGQNEIAAVGVASQVFFLISLFFFGIASGTSIFISQYYGSGDTEKMRKVTALATSICITGAAMISIVTYIFPEAVIRLFSEDPTVIELGATYLELVAVSYVFVAVSMTLSIGFRSVNKAHVPMFVTLLSLTTNAIGNYLLIFGIGPFPMMGVAGAAISTTVSRLLEMLVVIAITWGRKQQFAFGLSSFSWDRAFLSGFLRTSMPVVLNELVWALGMVLYKLSYSKIGTEALATINITESIANIFFIALMGIGNGATVIIGNALGAGEVERAERMGRDLLRISLFTGFGVGILEWFAAPMFASWFNVGPEVAWSAIACIRVNAILQPIKSLNMTTIVGILRAGGDTAAAFFCEAIALYAVGVPISFALVFSGAALWVVYIATAVEESLKLVLSHFRYRKKSWVKVLTV